MATTDPRLNLVIFEVDTQEGPRRLPGRGPAQAEDCIAGIWGGIAAAGYRPSQVRRVYSEWEPSGTDRAFIATAFPRAALTFSFCRPTESSAWPEALAHAQAEIEGAVRNPTPPQARPWWKLW